MVATTARFFVHGPVSWLAGTALVLLSLPASAGICEFAWEGEKMSLSLAGRPGGEIIELRHEQQTTLISVDQLWAFYEAKRRVARAAGVFPEFVICSDEEPNAFAVKTDAGRSIVAVTAGMMRLVDADVGMAAAVVGHELAHYSLGHNERSQSYDSLIRFAALLAAIVVQAKSGGQVSPHHATEGAKAGIGLLSRKFDRDQEREADETGLKHMMAAGYDPRSALLLAERLRAVGDSGGSFFDTHPGWDERAERLQAQIVADPLATQLAVEEGASIEELSDAERHFNAARSAWRAGDTEAVNRGLSAAAQAGHAPAQRTLGHLHLHGHAGLPKDEALAARLFRLAADQGDAAARAELGLMYARGSGGLPKDANEAVRLFRLAALQGNTIGEANYGYAHIVGLGGADRDELQAVIWLRRAIQKGDAFAENLLGQLYVRALQLPRNDAEAARLFSLAAEQGYPRAQANLGGMYLRGMGGLERNEAEGLRLTRLAAEQGESMAQYNLGLMYERGAAGLPKDVEQAVQWYTKAAPQSSHARERLQALGRTLPAEASTR
jgi:TPR repeat protein/Zn-dependent protease with chaperone function